MPAVLPNAALAGSSARSGRSCTEGASDFDPFADLLHELNQPLTGLQCGLELATTSPRTAEQYLGAIREALPLVSRMRTLAEALREINDLERFDSAPSESMPMEGSALDKLLRNTLDDLQPVAECRSVGLEVDGQFSPDLCIVPRKAPGMIFRIFESALSQAARGSLLRVNLGSRQGQAVLAIQWTEERAAVKPASLSSSGLGLLVARAAWQQAGGEWKSETMDESHNLVLSFPLSPDVELPSPACEGQS